MEDEPGVESAGEPGSPMDQVKVGSDEEPMAQDPETPVAGGGPSPATPAEEGSPETPHPETSAQGSDQAPRTVLHHLTRHWLPEDERGGEAMLQRFGAPSLEAARHAVRAMGQRELRAAFQRVYGTPTHSYNNSWLRRKLLEALGLTTASQGRGGSGGRAGRPRRGDRRRGAPRGRGTYASHRRTSSPMGGGGGVEEETGGDAADESLSSPALGTPGTSVTPPMPTRRHHTRAASAVEAEAAAQSVLHTIAGAIDLISPFVSPIQSPQRGLSFRAGGAMPGSHDASPPDLARAARLYQQEVAAATVRQQYYQQQYRMDQQYQAPAAGSGEAAAGSSGELASTSHQALQAAGWPGGSPTEHQLAHRGHPWGILSAGEQEPGPSNSGGGATATTLHGSIAYHQFDRVPPGYEPYVGPQLQLQQRDQHHHQSIFTPPLDPEQARLYQRLVAQGIGAALNDNGQELGIRDAEPAEVMRARYYAMAQQLQYQERGWGARAAEQQEPATRRASSTPP